MNAALNVTHLREKMDMQSIPSGSVILVVHLSQLTESASMEGLQRLLRLAADRGRRIDVYIDEV